MASIYLYGLGGWLILVILAIINAIIRESVYGSYVTPFQAQQISAVIFIIILFIFTIIFLKVLPIKATSRQYLFLGLFWLALTIIFEFLFGHYIAGNSWSELLAAYNILRGQLWPAVLIAIALMPWIVSKINR
jgi:hypothetical protein